MNQSILEQCMLELFEVTCLLQGFRLGDLTSVNVKFVPGRAQGDESELLTHAGVWLAADPRNHYLIFPGHDGSYANGQRVPTGYQGFDRWQAWITGFYRIGLPPERVLSCVVRPGHEKITHTREETDGFVLRAQEQSWKHAIVLAHPHQLPRVMGCLLKSMGELKYSMVVWPDSPFVTSWHHEVYGSLGKQSLPRWHHIKEELSRILTYVDKGWMAPLTQVRDYLLRLHS